MEERHIIQQNSNFNAIIVGTLDSVAHYDAHYDAILPVYNANNITS